MSFIQLLEDTSLFNDGISVQQVSNLRNAMLADGKVESPEADYLFILKAKFSGQANVPEWATFFVEAMRLYLSHEDNSLNESRYNWLNQKIANSPQQDEIDVQLLNALAQK